MGTVNLKKLYPWITEDEYIELTDEMYEAIYRGYRQEENYRKRTERHKAYYSLDYADWVENYITEKIPSAEDALLHKEKMETLYAEIDKLTDTQKRRLCECYLEGNRRATIARQEGVTHGAVTTSIEDALAKLKKGLPEDFLSDT